MPKITDPDDLNVGTEITIDTAARTFTLVEAGNLVAKDGVTANALWAKFVDLWTSSTYQPFPFPMNIIDARSGQFIFGQDPNGTYNGWRPANDTTRQRIRDGGWSEFSSGGALQRQYVGIVALASGFPAGAQFYYQRASGGAAANFTFTDSPNEAIQVFGDASNGNFDTRSFFRIFCREYQYLYDDASLPDVGETGTGAYKVQLPVAVGSDLKILANDATVAANSPYTKILVRFFASAFQKDVDLVGTPRSFGVVVDAGTHSGVDGSASGGGSVLTSAAGGIVGADYTGGTLVVHNGSAKGSYTINGTPTGTAVTITGTFPGAASGASFTIYPATPLGASLSQIYTKIQYLLRQDADIDSTSGTVNGKTASALLRFVGDTLVCGEDATNPNGGGSGVLVEGISAADLNSIEFFDNGDVKRVYPFASAGSLNFNSFLTSGGTGYYRMYFSTLPGAGNDYGESGAVTVDNAAGADITGTISGASISFTFDYDGNTQGGRTPGTDAGITVVAGNPGSAKPVVATGTITRSKSVVVTLTAEQDRGYIA
jgi:hypothetical protein